MLRLESVVSLLFAACVWHFSSYLHDSPPPTRGRTPLYDALTASALSFHADGPRDQIGGNDYLQMIFMNTPNVPSARWVTEPTTLGNGQVAQKLIGVSPIPTQEGFYCACTASRSKSTRDALYQ